MARTETNSPMIICRPSQWREAAIVLSCDSRGAFPLVLIEPPPISEAAYKVQYAAYRPARERLNFLSSSAAAATAHRDDQRRLAAAIVDELTEVMTPYRSWWRQQRTIASIVAKLKCKRAILLFEPAPGDLDPLEAFPILSFDEPRRLTLPDDVERQLLVHAEDLDRLSDDAWRLLRGDEDPGDAIFVGDDEPLSWLQALADALASGRRLRAGGSQRAKAAAPLNPARNNEVYNEAVLVEAAADAAAIVGVQYAHLRAARLALTQPPDLSPVNRVIEKLDAAVIAASAADAEAPQTVLRELEDVVSGLVPNDLVTLVEGLPLTAFTAGLPYNFVRKGSIDWADKPIGHIVGNPTFQILSELHYETIKQAGLDWIFESGNIDSDETQKVAAAFRESGGLPLVIADDLTLPVTMMLATDGVPADVVYLNTHGSDRSVTLGAFDWPHYKLIRSGFSNQPIVFNNSCLSWTGIGRTFLMMGARAYLGTLWSVETSSAADFAEDVTRRGWRQNQPIAVAMHNSTSRPLTSRAYFFAGVVSSKFPPRSETNDRHRADVLTVIFRLMETVAVRGAAALGSANLFASLRAKAAELFESLVATLSDREQLEFFCWNARITCLVVAKRSPDKLRLAEEESAAVLTALAHADLPVEKQTLEAARVLLALGQAQLSCNRLASAVQTLQSCMQTPQAPPEVVADASLLLCDVYRSLGQSDKAIAAAKTAWRQAKRGAQTDAQRLFALGRLTQLYLAGGRPHRALCYARLGFKIATSASFLSERAVFKMDETRALMRLKLWSEALRAATLSIDLARQTRSERDDLDLSAIGLAATCLLELGQRADAQDMMEQGLQVAKQRQTPIAIADFLLDVAKVKRQSNEWRDALLVALEAVRTLADVNHDPKLMQALGTAADLLEVIRQAKQLDFTPLVLQAIATELSVFGAASLDVRRCIVNDIPQRLLQLVTTAPSAADLEVIGALAKTAAEILRQMPVPDADMRSEMQFLIAVLHIVQALFAGDVPRARSIIRVAGAAPPGHDLDRFLNAALHRVSTGPKSGTK